MNKIEKLLKRRKHYWIKENKGNYSKYRKENKNNWQ